MSGPDIGEQLELLEAGEFGLNVRKHDADPPRLHKEHGILEHCAHVNFGNKIVGNTLTDFRCGVRGWGHRHEERPHRCTGRFIASARLEHELC